MNIKKIYSIPLLLLACTLLSLSRNHTEDNGSFVVVLDAGHGGHDPGNLGNGYLEKNIALNIVLKVGELLGKEKDVKVIYTRKDDTFIDLYVRGEIANKANADLFVSVHCDSHSSDAHGAGTFVLGLHANKQNFEIAKKENSVIYLEDNYKDRYADYDINSPESVIGLTIMQEEFLDHSILLAKMMQDNFSKKLKRTDRKVKQAGFIVLHQTFMPSVLVETGFLTNKNEGSYLNSKTGQSEMANAISQAIIKYKHDVTPTQTATIPKTPSPVNDSPTAVPVTKIKKADEKALPQKKEVIAEKGPEIEKKLPKAEKAIDRTKLPKKEAVAKVKQAVKAPVEEPKKKVADIVFKVQIMASSKNIALEARNFNGLTELSKEPYNNLYRYMHGKARSYESAKSIKADADAKGYTRSYIVSYKDGVRIPLKEALKHLSQQ